MRVSAIATGLLSLMSSVGVVSASAEAGDSATSKVNTPATFQPPQVFKNTNLVHIVSLEKNYVKDQINVVVENIDKEAQDEYYIPFTADQMSRIGSLEVRDRKEEDLGPFLAELVDWEPLSDIHYYRITFNEPLQPGQQLTLGITYYYTRAYNAIPASIAQDEQQFLSYDFSAYAPSAYVTTKQKTEVKCASPTIPEYTKVPGHGDVAEFPQKQGTKLTYGPFGEKPAGAELPISVRFEFTKPVIHVSEAERDIEVSHWGGNVAFEERYTAHHLGANLSSNFNRVKWAQSQYFNPTTFALKEFKFSLHPNAQSPYYTDVIGNVSTSKFRSNSKEASLETKPRYPIFGGWKYPFTIGWNNDAKDFVRYTAGKLGYVLEVPFFEGPKQAEGIEYEHVTVRVLLPEGAEVSGYYTNLPKTSVVDVQVGTHATYLDTVGRTSVTFKAMNLVDDFRDRKIWIEYKYSVMSALRKPLVIFGSMLFVFVSTWAIGNIEFGFAKTKC